MNEIEKVETKDVGCINMHEKPVDYKSFPRDNEVEVGIHFHTHEMTKEQLGKLFEAQKLLNEIGLGFDTGGGCGERDWEWDWSLSGPVHVTFRRMVKDNEKNRYVRASLPRENVQDSDSDAYDENCKHTADNTWPNS